MEAADGADQGDDRCVASGQGTDGFEGQTVGSLEARHLQGRYSASRLRRFGTEYGPLEIVAENRLHETARRVANGAERVRGVEAQEEETTGSEAVRSRGDSRHRRGSH